MRTFCKIVIITKNISLLRNIKGISCARVVCVCVVYTQLQGAKDNPARDDLPARLANGTVLYCAVVQTHLDLSTFPRYIAPE